MDVAFALLLAPALACTREPVFLLIDAIDEGDPPEQQRPDFKGSIMACANKALVLILQHLAPKLPTNVRFLLSSRPDAVGGGIQDILRRRFPDVVFLEPRHVREDGELPPGQTGRVLMTEAIIREYQTQGFELVVNRSATCGGLEELYSTYAAVFKLPPAKRPSSDAAAERTIAGVKLLLQVRDRVRAVPRWLLATRELRCYELGVAGHGRLSLYATPNGNTGGNDAT